MNIEDLLLSYMEANLDALKAAMIHRDIEKLERDIHLAKAHAEQQYSKLHMQRKA